MSLIYATNVYMRHAYTSLFTLLVACEQTTNLASSPDLTDGGMDADIVEEDAALDSGLSLGNSEAGTVAMCGALPCACSNGEDDDGDGQRDGFDSECTGPFDDDEETFRINDVNEGNPMCTDCFYDNNAKPGDDDCYIATSCSTEGMVGNGGGQCKTCTPSAQCAKSCEPITPNGCDCFGCCAVTHAGTTVSVRLEETCKVELIADTKLCPRCTLSATCQNPCERCELCPGKTPADLPKDCVSYSCDGRKVCNTPSDCQLLEFCSQGCCVPILL